LTVESADGCPVAAVDEGSGPVAVIISGAGLDDGGGYARLAAQLRDTCRVLRLTRRQYRADVERWRPVEIADEASDVVALARAADGPCYLFGHSAGGAVALEAAIAAPECFDAIALYEPAVDLTELPLGGPSSTLAARQAIDTGRPGRALEIFLRDMAGAPPVAAKLARLVAVLPRFRARLIPGQIANQEALERLGDRLTQYRGIRQHVLLIGGRSPLSTSGAASSYSKQCCPLATSARSRVPATWVR
jgi:pimeloyl-ACP methyl ester carboxylesterase